MALPIYFYDSIDIINRPLNVNIKVKNIKSMGLGKKIAETKMADLNAASVESAMSMIAGAARSMGVEVVDQRGEK